MSPDELRALADALDKITPVMGLEELHHMATLDRAANYLRACAEERPVEGAVYEDGGVCLIRRGTERERCNRRGGQLLYLHPAPAAPQAEPPVWKRLRDAGFTPRDNRIACDECGQKFTPQFLPIHKCEAQAEPKPADRCRSSETPSSKATSAASPERQALNLEDAAAQVAAGSGEQAEPKREPLSDDDINKLAWKQNLWTDHMIEFSFLAFAREVERAHGIGGSDDAK